MTSPDIAGIGLDEAREAMINHLDLWVDDGDMDRAREIRDGREDDGEFIAGYLYAVRDWLRENGG